MAEELILISNGHEGKYNAQWLLPHWQLYSCQNWKELMETRMSSWVPLLILSGNKILVLN